MKKSIVISFLLLFAAAVLIAGCGQPASNDSSSNTADGSTNTAPPASIFGGLPEFTKESIVRCQEGKFAPNKNAKALPGYEVDYVLVQASDNGPIEGGICSAYAVLKKPTMIAGTEVKSLKTIQCDRLCAKGIITRDPELIALGTKDPNAEPTPEILQRLVEDIYKNCCDE